MAARIIDGKLLPLSFERVLPMRLRGSSAKISLRPGWP